MAASSEEPRTPLQYPFGLVPRSVLPFMMPAAVLGNIEARSSRSPLRCPRMHVLCVSLGHRTLVHLSGIDNLVWLGRWTLLLEPVVGGLIQVGCYLLQRLQQFLRCLSRRQHLRPGRPGRAAPGFTTHLGFASAMGGGFHFQPFAAAEALLQSLPLPLVTARRISYITIPLLPDRVLTATGSRPARRTIERRFDACRGPSYSLVFPRSPADDDDGAADADADDADADAIDDYGDGGDDAADAGDYGGDAAAAADDDDDHDAADADNDDDHDDDDDDADDDVDDDDEAYHEAADDADDEVD
eukprot:6191352-Pyramimonas_sp.AAC.1